MEVGNQGLRGEKKAQKLRRDKRLRGEIKVQRVLRCNIKY